MKPSLSSTAKAGDGFIVPVDVATAAAAAAAAPTNDLRDDDGVNEDDVSNCGCGCACFIDMENATADVPRKETAMKIFEMLWNVIIIVVRKELYRTLFFNRMLCSKRS